MGFQRLNQMRFIAHDPVLTGILGVNALPGHGEPDQGANNDAGLKAHPSNRFEMNRIHFQLAMVAYNLNAWLMLFNREPVADAAELKHTTLAIARLRFLFIAAKIWSHAGRTGIHYSDQYQEQGLFQRLMVRLRAITTQGQAFSAVIHPALD